MEIGWPEAEAIKMGLERKTELPGGPVSHCLMLNVIQGLGATLQEIRITDIKEDIFIAEIRLMLDSQKLCLDARPSDAMALIIQENMKRDAQNKAGNYKEELARIFVAKKLLEQADQQYEIFQREQIQQNQKQAKQWLANLNDDEAEKFKI